MPTITESLALAVQHHQAGRLRAAEPIYLRILGEDPANADVLHLLGLVHAQAGDHRAAVAYLERALMVRPDWAEALANLGNVLREQGRPDEAVPHLRRALGLRPGLAAAHNNLGNALEAIGEAGEAIARYRSAIAMRPDLVEAHINLGRALGRRGDAEGAIACHRRVVALRPDSAEAHLTLAQALHQHGDLDEAIAAYRRALELRPDLAEAQNDLGNALAAIGRAEEAIAQYRSAIALRPDLAEAHTNLGIALKNRGEPTAAADCHRRALEVAPRHAGAHTNLGNALRDRGDVDGAIDCYRRAMELEPDHVTAHSNWLDTLHYLPGITPSALAEAHAGFDRRHAAPLRRAGAHREPTPDPGGRIRLGFVSPDFGRHPVGYFLVRVLEELDRARFETIGYSDRLIPDAMTDRLRAAASRWLDVSRLDDERLAARIRDDRVDILFDLAGHTARHRLLVFARRPAPIQVTWLGYAGTTGLTAIDYLLADRHQVPEGSERHYAERILRMPDGYACYDPPADAPLVGPPPSCTSGRVTFGSFNNPAKVGPDVVAAWAGILARVPSARLLLKYRGFDDPGVRRRYLEMFAGRGIDPGRVDLEGWSPNAGMLAAYGRVDIALDPFPYSGGLTTCEAMWMGVPVVTCPGETFAGRHSLSHLSAAGLAGTVARDLAHYADLAVELAGDPARLAGMRADARPRMAASPLCDGRRFAGHLASRLAEVWASGPPTRTGGGPASASPPPVV